MIVTPVASVNGPAHKPFTSAAIVTFVDNVYLIKSAPVPVGGTLVVVGGDQKVVMEPGDTVTVQSDTASSADVVMSHLDIT